MGEGADETLAWPAPLPHSSAQLYSLAEQGFPAMDDGLFEQQPLTALALSYMRRASAAALHASSALRAPTHAVQAASAYVADATAYVAAERKALMAAALGWASWPIAVAARPITVLRPRKGGEKSVETVRLEVKLNNGQDLLLELPAECTLAEGREQVARAAGLPLRRQFFVVAEERVRAAGLSVLARRVGRHLAAPRDLRASVVSWINFVFLPEAVNRELYGRGLIGSLKASTWYQQLQEKQKAAAARMPAREGVRVQVETLAGSVLTVEVDASASLDAMRAGIEREVGVMAKQQRLIILERTGPGALTHLTNRVFLHSWAGAKAALGAAAWAGCQLLGAGRPDARFRLAVRTAAGRTTHLSVTGDMTLDQIRELVEASAHPAGGIPSGKGGPPDGPPDAAAVVLSPPGTPDKAAAAAAAAAAACACPPMVVTTAAAAAAAAAAPKVALAEIAFPDVLPPRRALAMPSFVRIVDI